MKYLLASFETSLELRTVNRAIMFWSSMIVVYLNVEITMSVVACACSCKSNSLNFNYFCSSFATCDLWGILKLEPP
jgi:hypothetical protein